MILCHPVVTIICFTVAGVGTYSVNKRRIYRMNSQNQLFHVKTVMYDHHVISHIAVSTFTYSLDRLIYHCHSPPYI